MREMTSGGSTETKTGSGLLIAAKMSVVRSAPGPRRNHQAAPPPPSSRNTATKTRMAIRMGAWPPRRLEGGWRSEEHTSELQSLMRISYAVFCLKKKKQQEQTKYLIKHKKTTK